MYGEVPRCPVRLVSKFSRFCWRAYQEERNGTPLVEQTARWFAIKGVLIHAENEYREKTKQHE